MSSTLSGLGYFDRQTKRLVLLSSPQSSIGVVSENTITYPNVFDGVDVAYEYQDTKLKSRILISQEARDSLPDPAGLQQE